jgi:hypothetical protein
LGIDSAPNEICAKRVRDESRVDGQRSCAKGLCHDVTAIKAAPRVLQALSCKRDFVGPLEVKEPLQRHKADGSYSTTSVIKRSPLW